MSDKLKWTLLVGSATVVASFAARRALDHAWTRATGSAPPEDPDLDDHGTLAAIGWSMAVAGVAGAARLLARKGAAEGWRRYTSDAPPLEA